MGLLSCTSLFEHLAVLLLPDLPAQLEEHRDHWHIARPAAGLSCPLRLSSCDAPPKRSCPLRCRYGDPTSIYTPLTASLIDTCNGAHTWFAHCFVFGLEHRAGGCRFSARSEDLAAVRGHCQICPVWQVSCLTCGESVEKKDFAQHQGICQQQSEDAKRHKQAISTMLLDDATLVVLAKRRDAALHG